MENERKVKQNVEVLRSLIKNVDVNALPYLEAGGRLMPRCKKGNEIHIKKANRGKFTTSAKRAGQSVQEHAKSVLSNPRATPLQKKRANFARNAASWSKK